MQSPPRRPPVLSIAPAPAETSGPLVEVETAVIGLALAFPESVPDLRARGVHASLFGDPGHARIWNAIEEAEVGGIVEIAQRLRDAGGAALADRVHTFVEAAPVSPTQAPWYIDRLLQQHQRRLLARLGAGIAEQAQRPGGDLSSLLDGIRDQIDAIGQVKTGGGRLNILGADELLEIEPPAPNQVFRDFWDCGDKLAIIGPSKVRKSFFVLLLALAVAIGVRFAGLEPSRRRRVLYVNLEIRGHHFHRRLRRIVRALHIDPAEVGDRFHVLNVRDRAGARIDLAEIRRCAEQVGAEAVFIDPLYKLHEGDENAAHDMKPVMRAFDALTEATGAALAYVHHDAKGASGDRSTRDRGAGSNVLGRDYDAALVLTPHREDDACVCLDYVARNYAPRPEIVLRWTDDCFVEDGSMAAEKETAGTRAAGKPAGPGLEVAFRIAASQVWNKMLLVEELRGAGFSARGSTFALEKLFSENRLVRQSMGWPRQVFIGTPEAMASHLSMMTREGNA